MKKKKEYFCLVQRLYSFSSKDRPGEIQCHPDQTRDAGLCPTLRRLLLRVLCPLSPYFLADWEFLEPSLDGCAKGLVTTEIACYTQQDFFP